MTLLNPTCIWSYYDVNDTQADPNLPLPSLPLLADTISDYAAAVSSSLTPDEVPVYLDRIRAKTANEFCRMLGFNDAVKWSIARMTNQEAITISPSVGGQVNRFYLGAVKLRRSSSDYFGPTVFPHVFAMIRCERN
jgi:hypothetical protein